MTTPRGIPDYDQAPKRLLLRAHDAFLALIAPGVTVRGELSPELPAVGRQADFAWQVEESGQRARRPGYAMRPGRREGGEEETR